VVADGKGRKGFRRPKTSMANRHKERRCQGVGLVGMFAGSCDQYRKTGKAPRRPG
jgi:hypothetical protein